jgi:N-acyl-D-amino-acid deacylase
MGEMFMRRRLLPLALLLTTSAAPPPTPFDTIIRGGMIVDGSGGEPFAGDVAIKGDQIVAVAPHIDGAAAKVIDARGLAIAPGFVNMLSWANDALIEDGAAESDIRQGVTLEVMGEGNSEGPYNEKMVADTLSQQVDIKHPISWRTLGGYWEYLEKRGIAPNVASFVGATSVRTYELGEDDVDPAPAQLQSYAEPRSAGDERRRRWASAAR